METEDLRAGKEISYAGRKYSINDDCAFAQRRLRISNEWSLPCLQSLFQVSRRVVYRAVASRPRGASNTTTAAEGEDDGMNDMRRQVRMRSPF